MAYWVKTKRKKKKPVVPACRHYWDVGEGELVATGKCRFCGEERTFLNRIDENPFETDTNLRCDILEDYIEYLANGGVICDCIPR